MLRKRQQFGFTLLELLVVISIIGLLASTFIFGYAGWTDKARLANTRSFSQSVRSKVGFNVVGSWTFDDSTAVDVSGNNNNGTLVGTYSFVDAVMRTGIQFNGGRVYLNSLTQTPQAMTFAGWFKKTDATWSSIAFLGKRYGSTGWMLYRNSGDTAGYFRWYSFYENTSGATLSYRAWPGISGLQVDVWYFFTLTRDALGNMRIYVDGKQTYSGTAPADFRNWSDNAYGISIGSERAGSGSWNCTGAIFDDVAIYSETFNVTQVQQLYVEGLSKHNLALNQK